MSAASARLVPDPRASGRVLVALEGVWRLGTTRPRPDVVLTELGGRPELRQVGFASDALGDWDSSLLVYLRELDARLRATGVELDRSGLPSAASRLLDLAATGVPPGDRGGSRLGPIGRLGRATLGVLDAAGDAIAFIGETALALGQIGRGRVPFRWRDLALVVDQTGPRALGIVGLVAVLVGMILAFIGAIQLRQFGAEVYVANLVGLGMVREMGAIMAAVVMAGRTGAAFAAELGTMKVNEEIDAFATTGLSPVGFLVLPRLIGLVLTMPLLAVYSIWMGILGGAAIGIFVLGIAPAIYWNQTLQFMGLNDAVVGVLKGFLFAFVVGLSGCYFGVRAGRDAAAVGKATTSAVVTSIVGIIVVNAIVTVLADAIGA